LRRTWADRADDLVQRYPVSPAEVLESAAVDLLCSTRGADLALALAERAAAAAAEREVEDLPTEPLTPAEVSGILTRLPILDPARARARLAEVATADRGYARFCARVATPELIRRELELGRLEWIRLECRVIQFETEPLAREAALCLREDGLAIEDVAADAHAPVQEMRFYLGELDPEVQPRLLAAVPGELVGPVPFDQGHALFLVVDKTLPTEADPELRQRVENRAVARVVADQVNRRVRWRDR
jgi:hypothetical protein